MSEVTYDDGRPSSYLHNERTCSDGDVSCSTWGSSSGPTSSSESSYGPPSSFSHSPRSSSWFYSTGCGCRSSLGPEREEGSHGRGLVGEVYEDEDRVSPVIDSRNFCESSSSSSSCFYVVLSTPSFRLHPSPCTTFTSLSFSF